MKIQEFDRKLAKILKPHVKDRIYAHKTDDGQYISNGHIIARIDDCPKVKALLIEQGLPLEGTYVTHLGYVEEGRDGWTDEFNRMLTLQEGEKATYTEVMLNGYTNLAIYKTEQDLQVFDAEYHGLIESKYGDTAYIREGNLLFHQSVNGALIKIWVMRHRFIREVATKIGDVITKFAETKIED